ncbi:hypothetical protein OG2516_09765 [Oceanicola granulosus HTCC2516]|uniref:Peptidase inhibitor I78 family protein n=1 Tax=Oceanicola granulosus (strain ATCC BAA-861 / DSM 15982 / KCTC 12143 / HTCC2516) TaxID=314256 RepID=Q2CCV1_OCEGH|nr:hypothetical protein [Oceanicola granulosus]EAR50522.1 hypothetical protein OG2516_09765 [Oceanicola granulosus HTCC2516]
MNIKLALLLPAFALAACDEMPVSTGAEEVSMAAPVVVPFVPRQPEVNDPSDPCFAGSYLDLLGRNVDNTIIQPPGGLRIDRPGLLEAAFDTAEPLPAEERVPTRLSVRVDAAGTIEQVYCG